MFSGIVGGTGTVVSLERKPGLVTLGIKAPRSLCSNLSIGASVSIDGTCLTITSWTDCCPEFSVLLFDLIQETLDRTCLNLIKIGSIVNLERSLRTGDEIGGHLVSGHVDCTATIVDITNPENNHIITLAVPPNCIKYIFPKGFIAINGASLTVVDRDRTASTFRVSLIPETLRQTSFSSKRVGDRVNIEIDRQGQAIVDTITAFLTDALATGQLKDLIPHAQNLPAN
jgi:riboflavin synthase